MIWISSWTLYFSSAAAAWLRSRRALHSALAGRCASFGTLTCSRRGRLVGGADTIPLLLAQEWLTQAVPVQSCWTYLLWWLASCRAGQNEVQMHPPSSRCRHRSSPAFLKNQCKILRLLQWSLLPDDATLSMKFLLKTNALAARGLKRHCKVEGMDSKGLDVCNSLERDKACWCCCCPDGRKAAGHDCLDNLTVCLHCTAGASWVYHCYKTGQGSSNKTCRIFGCPGNHVKGTILLWSTVLTALSDQTDSCFCSQSRSVYAAPKFIKHHGTKTPLGQVGQSWFTTALVHFQKCAVDEHGSHFVCMSCNLPCWVLFNSCMARWEPQWLTWACSQTVVS